MDYSINLLTSQPDCQALINIAQSEKEGLAYRKTGLERQRETATVTSMGIDTDLSSVSAELEALQTIMDNLPEGPIKQETLVRFKKAEYKKFLLEQRKENYGVLSLLGKEYDIARIEKDIVETDAFINSVTARMGELPVA